VSRTAGVTVLTLVVAGVVTPGRTLESKRPSFAGHWVMASGSLAKNPGQVPPICRLECLITQDENVIVVKTPGGETIKSYVLSGSPVKTTAEVLGRKVEYTDTARWEGSTVLIVSSTSTASTAGKQSRGETRLRISLQNGFLVFERTMTQPWGAEEHARFQYERRK